MNKIIILFSAVATAITAASCSGEKKTNTETAEQTTTNSGEEAIYQIAADTNSRVIWKGVMLGIKEHFGTLNFKEGQISVKGNQVTGGNFIVDMNTINPTDKNYDAKTGYGVEKFISHITSADFFDVANYPTASFTITSVNGNEATGTLSIRGKENTETVKNISVTEENGIVTAKGTLTFNRKNYDVAWDMPAKDMIISNDVELQIQLSAKK